MAYSDREIRDSYLVEITKWCPVAKGKRGTWVNSCQKRGKLSEEMLAHLQKRREK